MESEPLTCPRIDDGEMTIDDLILSLSSEIKVMEEHMKLVDEGVISDPCPECRRKDILQKKRQLKCVQSMLDDLTDLNHGILRLLKASIYNIDRGKYHFGINEGKDFIMLHISVKGKENADKVKAWLKEAES